MVGIFPNDAAIERLVGAVLLEQDEHWQLEGRRMFSAESMAERSQPSTICLLRPAYRKQQSGRRRQLPTRAAEIQA